MGGMNMIRKIPFSNHEEWLQIRRGFIGGSDAGAVVGLDEYKSPYSLWAEKTGRIPPFEGNITTKVGAYLEELVAQMFTEETGKKVRKHNFTMVNDLFPWACANVDRLVNGEKAILEIKTSNSFPVMRQCRNGEFPARWWAQVCHYLAVTGLEKAYLAVLIRCRELKIFELERDNAEIAALMEAERDFWQLVQSDTPPAIDGSTATTDAIKTIYKESGETVVDLFPLAARLDQYTALSQQIKELEAMRDEAANRIKAYMGEAWGGECDRYKVIWKSDKRRTFDSKRFAKENPTLDLSSYYKETSVRTFRVIEQKEA